MWYRRRIERLERLRAAQEAFSRQLIERQEAERKRVAGELHDSLGQNLLVVKNLALMGVNTHTDRPESAKQFSEISEAASQALTEVRAISRSLRPAELDRLGLTKALQAMLDRLDDSSPVEFHANLESVEELLPPEFQINLYRVVQEASNNILKHSGASKASITLKREGSVLHLRVEDNGHGFDPHSSSLTAGQGGFGLSGMEERVRLVGGEIMVKSRPGEGTTIDISIPVSNRMKSSQEAQVAVNPDPAARA